MKMRYVVMFAGAVLAVLPVVSCRCLAAEKCKLNSLTRTEEAAGWRLLFDGEHLTGWSSGVAR